MSMIAWMAAAVVPDVPHPKAKALTDVAHPKSKAVEPAAVPAAAPDAVPAAAPDAAPDAAPEVTVADPIASVDPAGAAAVPALVPTGPVTPAEEKADSVLSCINGCGAGGVTCMNQCIYTGYNVPSAPPANTPPPVVPTPLPSSATPVSPSATPTGTAGTAGSSASKSQWHVASAAVALAFSLFFMARLGLSWVLGFYSASLFTLGGFYEAPHLRTIFNNAVDYPATASVGEIVATAVAPSSSLVTTCRPTLSTAAALLASWNTSVQPTPALPLSFLHLDSDASPKSYCFSELAMSPQQPQQQTDNQSNIDEVKGDIALRHKFYQAQMTAPHLVFSLENYPDDGRIGPHIIAANFQAFLVVDLLMGFLHYRRQLEPFSTVVHHIIYYFIVVHMRKGDMLSRRTPFVEGSYVLSFVTTRLLYVSLLWHEVYYNYPDKSVAVLYTITLALHVYWFVLYIHLQKRYRRKCQRSHLSEVLQSLANSAQEETMRLKAKARKVSSCSSSSPQLRGSPTFVRQWSNSGSFEQSSSIFERGVF
ncbi:hypothetical protein CPB97_003384 [Podila verticillata]|nr:hypothetical protein CPB97_003384 [Podila verticillata]